MQEASAGSHKAETTTSQFGELHEGAIDAAGNIFLAADEAIFSLDPHLSLRWARRDIHVDGRAFMLYPDGRLWVRGRTSAVFLSCADGQTLGAGPNFPRSPVSSKLEAYAVHGNSVLVATMQTDQPHFRVARFTLDGQQIPVFEKKKKGMLAKMFGTDGDGTVLLRNAGVKLCPALGSDVFMLDSPNFDVQLSLCSADGSTRWRRPLPLQFPHLMGYRILAEPDGGVLLAENHSQSTLRLDGSRMQQVSSSRTLKLRRISATGMVDVGPERAVSSYQVALLTSQGEILVFGSQGEITRLAHDGRELWSNEAAKRHARELEIAAQGN